MDKNVRKPVSPAEISVSLLGGSSSGKTTFIFGLLNTMVEKGTRIGGNVIYLRPVSIGRGEAMLNRETDEITENLEKEELSPTVSAADALSMLRAANTGGEHAAAFSLAGSAGAPPAFGGGAPAAFSGAPAFGESAPSAFGGGGAKKPAGKDSRQVENIDVNEIEGSDSISASMLLNRQLREFFNVRYMKDSEHGGFQAGTSVVRYIKITFEVTLNGTAKCLLTITDYAGELVDLNKDVPGKMLNLFTNYIDNSDAIIALASAEKLSQEQCFSRRAIPGESIFNLGRAKEETSAQRINDLMATLHSRHPIMKMKDGREIPTKNFTFLLAITQTDHPKVAGLLKENDFARVKLELKNRIFQPTFDNIRFSEWSSGILPVSAIGRDNVDGDNQILEDSDIKPEDVDTAVLFCLYNSILAKEKEMQEELAPLKKKLIKSPDEKEKINELETRSSDLDDLRDAIMSDNGSIFRNIYEKNCVLEEVARVGEIKRKK